MLPLVNAPGGFELVIMLVMMLLMLGIPLAFAVGMFFLGRWSANRGSDVSEEQIAGLQARVDDLEAEHAVGRSNTEAEGEADANRDSQSDASI